MNRKTEGGNTGMNTLLSYLRGFLQGCGLPVKGECRVVPKPVIVVVLLAIGGGLLGVSRLGGEAKFLAGFICLVILILGFTLYLVAVITRKAANPVNEAYREIAAAQDYAVLPVFAYMPNAYEDGTVKRETARCGCCEREVDQVVEEGIFWKNDMLPLCPWCVASGAASVKYNCFFNDETHHDGIPDEVMGIIFCRTPSIKGWQEVPWPGCCSDAMLYLEAVKTKAALEKYRSPEFQTALDQYRPFRDFDQLGPTLDQRQGGLIAHVFQCRHCKKYALNFDSD